MNKQKIILHLVFFSFFFRPNSKDCPRGVTESALVMAVSPLNDIEEDNDGDIDGPENHGISRRPYYRTLSPDTPTQGQASNLHPSPSSFRNNGRSINVLPSMNLFIELFNCDKTDGWSKDYE